MRNIYESGLREMLIAGGADLVGFSCVRDELPEELKMYPYAVTIVRKLAKAVTNTIQGAPTMIYFQHYRMTNTKLDLLALDAVSFIEKQGYLALPIAASQSTPDAKEEYKGVFPHKTGAVKSGLGFIGKSGVLITEEYGSFYSYLVTFTRGETIYETDKTTNNLSDAISKYLQSKGMKFVGSVIIYSYLQSIGVIYSHDKDCFLHGN